MNKILITGADSFIGKNFLIYSRYGDVDEISLFENKPENIDFKSYDVVIHLVAIVHESQKIPDSEYFKINKDLCIKVAENARADGVKQFIFLSTVKVYGEFLQGSGPWHELSSCHPTDAYGKSKYEAEIELKKLETEGFTISVVRTPLVYGQGVRANMDNIIRLVYNVPVLPFGGINNKRNFTYIENLVDLLDLIIEQRASGTFIAMDEESLSTTQLVRLISGAQNKKRYLIHPPGFLVKLGKNIMPRIFDRLFGSFELDNSRTKKTLGYKAPFSAEEGILRTVKALYDR